MDLKGWVFMVSTIVLGWAFIQLLTLHVRVRRLEKLEDVRRETEDQALRRTGRLSDG